MLGLVLWLSEPCLGPLSQSLRLSGYHADESTLLTTREEVRWGSREFGTGVEQTLIGTK